MIILCYTIQFGRLFFFNGNLNQVLFGNLAAIFSRANEHSSIQCFVVSDGFEVNKYGTLLQTISVLLYMVVNPYFNIPNAKFN